MSWRMLSRKMQQKKIKMKWENIYTTLPEGDDGSASFSLLYSA